MTLRNVMFIPPLCSIFDITDAEQTGNLRNIKQVTKCQTLQPRPTKEEN